MFQTPFSDLVRNVAGIPTMTVGAITTHDEVNSILAAGRADLCVLARPHLRDPYWTLHAAQMQEYYDLPWPPQYESVQPAPREKLWFLPDPREEAAQREQELHHLRRRVWELEQENRRLRESSSAHGFGHCVGPRTRVR
jgi:hypothetical protein